MTLDQAAYFSLATFRKTGVSVETPVWFAGDKTAYYVFSAGQAGKVKRLRNSPKSRIAPCNVIGKVLGDWQQSQAFILTTNEDIQQAHTALIEKYGWQMRLTDLGSWLTRKKSKRAYIKVVLVD
tara:strand:- start:6 stop:377 length:372 start_codon:yes stop_codon:yes gene_type:complete